MMSSILGKSLGFSIGVAWKRNCIRNDRSYTFVFSSFALGSPG